MTLGNARSEDFSNAVQSLIDTLTGSDATTADDVTPNELSSLQSALAALPLSSAPPQGLPDDAGYDSGSGLLDGRPGLWEQLLDVAGELDEEDGEMYRGEPSNQQQNKDYPSFLAQLETILNTKNADEAASLRMSISDALSAPGKNEDLLASELAEVLGFEHLDLVGDLVANKSTAAAALAAGQSESAQPVSATQSRSMSPTQSYQHQERPSARPLKANAKPYTPGAQVVVQSAEEIAEQKALRAAQRRALKGKNLASGHDGQQLSPAEMERLRMQQLEENAHRPLFSKSGASSSSEPKYPHVFSSGAHGNVLSVFGSRFSLPAGTTRAEHKEYEEVTIPPPRAIPMRTNERLIPIGEMDPMCRGAFPGYKSLNRLQSVVYPLGYGSNENLLICAPTGAGKTDVAMLTVLRAISQYSAHQAGPGAAGRFGIRHDEFKVVYVAPMKALAAEVVRKFSKRLAYLGVKVRELTGDMQLTRQEIAETQMIVTTPEKWDVVTRKPSGAGEGELASKVKLLIIDEVHLLHEDRGAVIETIVARTLRLVESSQSLIRIVGLSATLPNYVDVADFLRVNRYQGLFYFDSSFRPVPLEQHFIGVRGKPGSGQSRTNLDKATFLKVEQLIQAGHQVMIFVHARKETVKTAMTLREMCRSEGIEDLLLAGRDDKEGQVSSFKRDLSASRNKELRELFESGLGIHHAGMLRSDRTLSERMFEAGITKVLCCTSTLAWGVNLPAYAVLIKGTEVYDSSLGKFVDLSILDVLQIFGRAGRPQYEDLGVGYICTPQEKLSHYIDAITSQHPIESKFEKGLVDSLNAECALGTVQSVQDGITWLSYTYMFTRMRRNPMSYGMSRDEVAEDPHLGAKRLSLITGAAKRLVACKMMELDETAGKMTITELGRIAARYYIPWRTIEIFNEKLRPKMTEADVLSVLSLATDFEQIIPRDSEAQELKRMLEKAPCEVPGGFDTSAGKVNTLLQAYISRTYVEDFALASDSAYVAQNTGRIIRALFEIALSKKWSSTTSALISMSKAVERRMWPFDHPLSQSNLTKDTMYNLQRWADEVEVSSLAQMPAKEIGELIHLNERIGSAVRDAAKQFPHLKVHYSLRPITSDQVQIVATISRAFEWNERLHRGMEPFYVWVEDEHGSDILQWTRAIIRGSTTTLTQVFNIAITEPRPSGVSIRWVSDSWIGSEDTTWVPFDDLVMPATPAPHLPLLDLPLLPLADAFEHFPSEVKSHYEKRLLAFNAIQTQAFHTVLHTELDVLLAGPVGSGKSTLAQLAVWRTLQQDRTARILIVVPHPRILLQTASAYSHAFPMVRTRIAASPGELAREDRSLREEVVFALPAHALKVAMMDGPDFKSSLHRFQLVVAEDLHMMSPAYEMALTRLRQITASTKRRLLATSASLYDAASVADWLGIEDAGRYSFAPKDRPLPLQVSTQSFDVPHSYGLLKLMAKPVYDKARAVVRADKGPVIIFVPSRSQCLPTATDLVTKTASDLEDQEGFLGAPSPEDLEPYLVQLSDERLHEPILNGIALYHDGLSYRDRTLVLDLFRQGIIKVLVAPRESCWSMPARAGLVVVMGAQYVKLAQLSFAANANAKTPPSGPAERITADYSAQELLRMASLASGYEDTKGRSNAGGECLILCQKEQSEQISYAMQHGLPLESELLLSLSDAVGAGAGEEEAADGPTHRQPYHPLLASTLLQTTATHKTATRQTLFDFFSWTHLCRRLAANPSYYGASAVAATAPPHVATAGRLSALVDAMVRDLLAVRVLHPAGGAGAAPEQVLELDELGRILTSSPRLTSKNGPDLTDAIGALLELRRRVSHGPESLKAVAPHVASSKAATQLSKGAQGLDRANAVLAIRDSIPGPFLDALRIPRAQRQAKKNRAKAAASASATSTSDETGVSEQEKEGGTSKAAEEEAAGIALPALLLAEYFSPHNSSRAAEVQKLGAGTVQMEMVFDVVCSISSL